MKVEQGLSLRDTLDIIYRRINLLRLTVLLLPVGVLVTCLLVTPVYQSTAKIIITAKKETSALLQYSRDAGPSAVVNLNVDERDLNSEMDLLRSPDLWIRTVKTLGVESLKPKSESLIDELLGRLDRFLETIGGSEKVVMGAGSKESPEVYETAVNLMNRFKVTAQTKSKILDVSFKYPDPVQVHRILATLLDEYLPYHTEVYSVPGVEKFFGAQGDIYRTKLDAADEKLMQFKKEWGIALPERQKAELITLIKQIQDSLVDANANLSQYERMMASLNQGIIPSGQLSPSSQRGNENTFINVVAAQLLRAEQKQWQTAEIFLVGSRDFRSTSDMVRDLMNRFRGALQVEMEILRAKKASLEDSLKTKEQQLNLLEEKSEQARRLNLEVTVAKERYLQYLSKEEEARVETVKGAGNLLDVKAIGLPVTSPKPVFPQTFLFVLGAFFLSIPLGIGMILVANFFDHTFSNPRELGSSTGLPVLASLGLLGKRAQPAHSRRGQ